MTKKTVNNCGQCYAYTETAGIMTSIGECRLNPPFPVNAHLSIYPKVREDSGACMQAVPIPIAKAKPKPKKKKEG